ncbi:Rapamycin-insensitive companion of mTOR, N-term-domain-containing protein [Gymnopilus junonius]|uniref:Rapamycin-insensitive companion of mTOR, N-term-domain-containing protein n=1 Tax=Gymnopilus junonius TaxID=109634 RepID=A0A9P5NL25_GYMJU|nr:Rapamycin-insensitive companion of mTOR, N-term-domain-containing protein [Gymnopilus junonius]
MPAHLTVPSASSSNMLGTSATSTLVNTLNGDDSFSFSELDGKEPSEQLDILNNQLAVENRIKEGAENLLNMTLTESQRIQVESELDTAKNKISVITKRIQDMQAARTKPKSGTAGTVAGNKKGKVVNGSVTSINDKGGEDFRTALQNATNCIKDLESIARSEASQSTPSHTGHSPKSNMQIAAAFDLNSQRIEVMAKLIDILRRNVRVQYELNFGDVLHAVLPCFGDKCSKQCRAAAYRVIRHSLVEATVSQLGEALDWYILKSLLRDNKHAVEKEQAIKLIRKIVEIGTVRPDSEAQSGSSTIPLSETVMRAIIAVAEHVEDPFRLICVQTLSEILIIDIDLAVRTGVIRFLLHVLGEGPVELAPILATVFLHLVDCPRTRAYIQVGTDLEMALSAITDAYGKGPDHADRMRGCAKVVQLMLRTWSGLMFFCLNDMRAIRSLIITLTIPSLDTREIILDMFFDLLNIKTPAWYQTFIDGRRLTMYRKSRDAYELHTVQDSNEKPPHTLKLTDQYLALLVAILTNAGLCEALTAMLEESTTGTNLSRKATLLMAEVLAMANRVLPLSMAAKIQAIPEVFYMATDYKRGESRIVGTSALSAIDSFNRNRARLEPNVPAKGFRQRANSVEDAVRRGQRQVEQVKLKMSMQMDDKTFQSCLLETQVMATKDHAKWNFEMLQELIEGPLLNPKRMEEAIKVSRFIRRLMSFFHPFNHRFSDIRRTRANTRWVRLACSVLTTLMATPDGVRYLATEDQFLAEIVKGFAQLDPFNGVPDSDPIFSKKRVAETLTYGYLEMLGTLSKFKDGIELLEKFKVFTAFYHLSELRSREDLIKGIIEDLDYSNDGHPRIVLSKALTSSYKHIRLYATRHLGSLIRGSPVANAWTLRLLLTQLYDPSAEVCELAVEFLEEACESKEILQLVVEMQPTMDHLGDIGQRLLLKFMSTPMGFRYLYDAGYIDREMESWFNERNIDYVVEVEVFLSKVFNYSNAGDDDDDLLEFDGTVPAHFYGEMAKTELGCQILQEKGHFMEFSQFIRQHSHENEDTDLILKLKSILWAVGNIGATEGGLHFCEEDEIIPAILEIAENSPIPSVRGTCFFVLGLISTTTQGAEILDDYHWEATLSPLGLPTGLCIPADIDRFISLPSWTPVTPSKPENQLLPPTAEPEIEAITAIQNLANTVIANAASRSLARIKARPETRGIFSSSEMFYRALHIMSTQRYRLPVRRYIVELFNQEMNQDLVNALNDTAKRLKPSPSYKPPRTDTIRMSVFGRLGKSRRQSESDESDEDDGLGTPPTQAKPVVEQPTINLQPLKKIIGFAV